LILKDSSAIIKLTFRYGGVKVSTGTQSIDCMRRIVGGPPKSSDKKHKC